MGILNLTTKAVFIALGSGGETSDFWVDCLRLWWAGVRAEFPKVKRLVIRLDNGPHCGSRRRQFLERLAEWAAEVSLEIHLVYYPPYHSKYNPIERVWGALERHWNGTLLTSTDVVREWAQTMTWYGRHPTVVCLDTVYAKGVAVPDKEMAQYAERIVRSSTLPKYDVTILPSAASAG